MKRALHLGFFGLMLSSTATYALNPVQGWYAGIFIGPSYQPNVNFTLSDTIETPRDILPASITGTLTHSVLGGVGGELGYRCNQLRGELQILYNNNPLNTLTIDDTIVKSPSSSTGLRLDGDTNLGAILINGFYDLYTPNEDGWSQVVPYVGGGVGYAYLQNAIQFYYNNMLLSRGDITETQKNFALQGIAGLSYFMDDFTTIGLDFRYFTTNTNSHKARISNNEFNTRFQLCSINLVFNGAFDYG